MRSSCEYCIEVTLVWDKPDARYFAGFVLFCGLAARFFTKNYPNLSAFRRGLSLTAWALVLIVAAAGLLYFEPIVADMLHENVVLFKAGGSKYATFGFGYALLMAGGASAVFAARYFSGKMPILASAALSTGLAATPGGALVGAAGTAPGELHLERPHVLVATRGGKKLLEFAAKYCHKTGGIMFVLFVRRQVNIVMAGPTSAPRVEEDPEALKAFALAAEICQRHNVQMLPMYAVSSDVPYTILDFAATYNAEAVLMGVSREGTILRALRGDVITAVADNLPEDISLLIHA